VEVATNYLKIKLQNKGSLGYCIQTHKSNVIKVKCWNWWFITKEFICQWKEEI